MQAGCNAQEIRFELLARWPSLKSHAGKQLQRTEGGQFLDRRTALRNAHLEIAAEDGAALIVDQ